MPKFIDTTKYPTYDGVKDKCYWCNKAEPWIKIIVFVNDVGMTCNLNTRSCRKCYKKQELLKRVDKLYLFSRTTVLFDPFGDYSSSSFFLDPHCTQERDEALRHSTG